MTFKIAHVIGRFQPFHYGHAAMVDHALREADRVVIILGDTGGPRDSKNPWTVAERTEMIQAVYKDEFKAGRIVITSVTDTPYRHADWVDAVWRASRAVIRTFFDRVPEDDYECIVVGHEKDETSSYLRDLPWRFVQSPVTLVGSPFSIGKPAPIDATSIRNSLYRVGSTSNFLELVPKPVREWIFATRIAAAGQHSIYSEEVALDFRAVNDFNTSATSDLTRKFGPPHLHAADALVIRNKHVLLIERTGGIGAGQIALPGGFIENHEWPHEAAIRELKEETGLDISDAYKSVRTPRDLTHVFAAPGRSRRGRTITHVLVHRLPHDFDTSDLRPQAGEVSRVFWRPVSELPALRERFFADHFHIINELYTE